MITIMEKLMNLIHQHCMAALPIEACGILIGHEIMDDKESNNPKQFSIDEFISITNTAANPEEHFELNPAEWIPLVYAYENNSKRQIVGILHSHPTTAAIPSYEDLSMLWNIIPSHWIVSLAAHDHIVTRAYHYKDSLTYDEIPIMIQNEVI